MLVDTAQLSTMFVFLNVAVLALLLHQYKRTRSSPGAHPYPQAHPQSYAQAYPAMQGMPGGMGGPLPQPFPPSWKSWLAGLPIIRSTSWARRYRKTCLEQLRLEPTRDHPLTMSVGRELLSFVDLRNERNLIQQVGWLRKEVHRELGLALPGVKFSDNLALDAFEYVVCFQGQELARGRIFPNRHLVLEPNEAIKKLVDSTWYAQHPVTGQFGVWIPNDTLGLVVGSGSFAYDALEVISLHLRHTFWHRGATFITHEYAQLFVQRALELEPCYPVRRQALEQFLPRLRKVLQNLLELGGDLKDPGTIVRVFETHMKRCESPEAISKRILEVSCSETGSPVDGSVAGAILYSAHWNEMLCMELFPNMDQQQLSQLTSGLLKMQHYPGPAVERLWNEIGTRSESLVWGRSNQELADQIRYILSRGLERPQPMSAVEKLAILILSFPKSSGPGLACQILEHLNRSQAGELASLLGRYALLWSEAPLRPDGRNLLEIGLRERVVVEFLDWLGYCEVFPTPYPGATLQNFVIHHARNSSEAFCSVLERHYFPSTEPIGHFRTLVSAQPQRTIRLMLQFWAKTGRRVTAQRRAAFVLSCLNHDLRLTMVTRLRGRGYALPTPESEPSSAEVQQALREFVYYFQSHLGLARDSKGMWQ